jgi:hypothetical protein
MKDKRAAMELSMGTIVILVLAMIMLIMGIVLIRTIFDTAGGAITEIDDGVKSEINKIFADPSKKLVLYPAKRTITLKQRSQGEGFAFAVRNTEIDSLEFTYAVEVDPSFDIREKCHITKAEADQWLLIDSGSVSLGPGQKQEEGELILFNIPDSAPPCTIPYKIDVKYGKGHDLRGQTYVSGKMNLIVEPR